MSLNQVWNLWTIRSNFQQMNSRLYPIKVQFSDDLWVKLQYET